MKKHLFNKAPPDRLSLPFRLLFCSRLALRSPPPHTHPAPTLQTHPQQNPIKTQRHWWQPSHSLWRFMISNSWQMDQRLGLDAWMGAPLHPLNYFHQITRRKELEGGGEVMEGLNKAGGGVGGAGRAVWDIFKVAIWIGWNPCSWLAVNLQPQPLPYKKDKSEEKRRTC